MTLIVSTLDEANKISTLYTTMRNRLTLFFGYVMRSETLESIVMVESIGDRSRGREIMLNDGLSGIEGYHQ